MTDRAKANAQARKHYWAHRDKLISRNRQFKKSNRVKLRKSEKEWRKKNPEKVRAYRNKYVNSRYHSDVNYRILSAVRSRLALLLPEPGTKGRSVRLLGCSIESFKIYLESKFEPGMNWDNYGRNGWHVDHIMPCSIFDLRKPEHQKRCFHFSNLQPMWEAENIRKSNKILTDQFNLL